MRARSITPPALCSVSECVLAVIRTTAAHTHTEAVLCIPKQRPSLSRLKNCIFVYDFPPVVFSPANTGITLFLSFWKFWLLSVSFLQLLVTSAKEKKINQYETKAQCMSC